MNVIAHPALEIESHIEKLGLVNHPDGIMSSEQASHNPGHASELDILPNNTVASNILTVAGPSQADFKIHGNKNVMMHGLLLEFDIHNTSMANLVKMAPVPFWFDRIELRSGNSAVLQTLRGFNLYVNFCSLLKEDQYKCMAKLAGLDHKFQSDLDQTIIGANATRKFVLPILGDFISSSPHGFPMTGYDHMMLSCFFHNSVEGGTGTPVLTNIKLRIQFDEMHPRHHEEIAKLYGSGQKHRFRFLDALSIQTITTVNFGSGTQRLKLDNISGKDAFDLVVLRSSTALANGAYRKFSSLGDSAHVKLLDSNGRNIGTQSGYLYDIERRYKSALHVHGNPKFFANSPIFPIFYSHDITSSYAGTINGYVLQDLNRQLEVFPSNTAAVAPILTLTLTGAAGPADGGHYFLKWYDPISKTEATTVLLAFDASVAAIQEALYSLPNWDEESDVTPSGALTTTRTFTFGGRYGNEFGEEITLKNLQLIPAGINDGGVGLHYPTTLTQVGVRGHPGSLQVDIYSHIFRSVVLEKGQLKLEDH